MRTPGAKERVLMSNSPQRKKLPINPSLEHLQKQAKRLVKLSPALQLAAAQHQVAQAYGFKNWAELARAVEAMVKGGPASDGKRYEPLPAAARAGTGSGDFAELRRLLQEADFTPLDLDQALAHVLWYGPDSTWEARKQMAIELLAQGADPNAQYGGGRYGPIIFGAAECLKPEALQFLIDAGADVKAPPVETKYGPQCVLSNVLGNYARGANDRKHQCINVLLQHGAFVPSEVAPAMLAIHRGDLAALDAAIAADPGLVTKRFPQMPFGNIALSGATLLHCAAELGEAAAVLLLLLRGADINATAEVVDGVGGQTALFHAIGCAIAGDPSTLDLMLPGDVFSSTPTAAPRLLARILKEEPILRREPVSLRLLAEARSQLDTSIWARVRRFGQLPPAGDALRWAESIAQGAESKERAEAVVQAIRAPRLAIYTPRALKAVKQATEEAERLGHEQVDVGHLLLALTKFSKGTVLDVLRSAGATPESLRKAMEAELPPGKGFEPKLGRSIYSTAFKEVLRSTTAAGLRARSAVKVDSAELLLAVASVDEGPVAKVLRAAGIDRRRLLIARSKVRLPPSP